MRIKVEKRAKTSPFLHQGGDGLLFWEAAAGRVEVEEVTVLGVFVCRVMLGVFTREAELKLSGFE